MQLQPSPNMTKNTRDSEQLTENLGVFAKPGLGGTDVRQNPAGIADVYRSSARAVLAQLGFSRRIPG